MVSEAWPCEPPAQALNGEGGAPERDPRQLLDRALKEAEQHYARGQLAAARDHLQQAVSVAPTAVRLLTTLASVEFQLGNYTAAHQSLTSALRLEPDNAVTYKMLAAVLVRLEQPDAFEQAIGRALALAPEDTEAWKMLGDYHGRQGRYLEAARTYHQILQFTPQDVGVLLALAKCLFKCGDLETTTIVYDEVLRIDPGNEIATEGLAIIARRPLNGAPLSSCPSPPAHPCSVPA